VDFKSQLTQLGVPLVTTSRGLTASAPLTGGGDLTADRSLGLSYDSTLQVVGGALGVSSLVALASHSHAFSALTGKPTTLSGYGITDGQPLDADLTSIAALAGTSGLLKKTAANTWALDTSAYLTANQAITVSGDASGSGSTAIALTLATVATPGTYRSVTVNAKGLVTAGTNPTTLAGYGIVDPATASVPGTMSASDFSKLTAYPLASGALLGQVLRSGSAGSVSLGALDLASANAVTGILPTAKGGTGFSSRPYFKVARASNSSNIASGTRTKLTFTDEVSDVNDIFDLTAANNTTYSKTRALAAGTWLFLVSVLWNSFSSSISAPYVEICIYKNGSILAASPPVEIPTAANYHGSMFSFIDVASGTDYYEVYVRQASGAPQPVYGDAGKGDTYWIGTML
jgi:hypothetical protein